eukprot:maker-scaffold719_size106944-snap-gene-0.22 protein:Tk04728 transcript:maker-scaffold719_size106944-snap-gene-0.22-mRNA-1 annotation:"e3 ubiquitin-protein ligase sinat1"
MRRMAQAGKINITCQVCLCVPRDIPIYLCSKDHNICAQCFESCEDDLCPFGDSCRCVNEDPRRRNLEAEEYIKGHDLAFHCRYQPYGCPEISRRSILEFFHEKACPYAAEEPEGQADPRVSGQVQTPGVIQESEEEDIPSPQSPVSTVLKRSNVAIRKESCTQTDLDSAPCPIPQCQRSFVPIPDWVDHLKLDHSDRIQCGSFQNGTAHSRNYLLRSETSQKPNFIWKPVLGSLEGQTFTLNFRKMDFEYYAWVGIVSATPCKEFQATMRIHNEKSALIYSKVDVLPVTWALGDILESRDCLCLSERFAQQCKTEVISSQEAAEDSTYAINIQFLIQKKTKS